MSWTTAYENQIVTWAFWNTDFAQEFARAFAYSVAEAAGSAPRSELHEELAETESHKLLAADPIYVEPEMMTVWEAAAETFKPEPFEASDLITNAGFVYLPRPVFMTDLHGMRCSWRAFAWESVSDPKPGIRISLYTHRDDDDDYGPMPSEDGTIGAQLKEYPLTLLHGDIWTFGRSYSEVADQIQNDEPGLNDAQRQYAVQGLEEAWRQIQALWRLMQQHVSVPEQIKPERAARRRQARAGRPEKMTERLVTVIRLRRPKKARQGEPQDVNWTHRWLVGGHWRNQWYPSLGIHRQIFIHPYIKGPEEKELRIREKRAFELVR